MARRVAAPVPLLPSLARPFSRPAPAPCPPPLTLLTPPPPPTHPPTLLMAAQGREQLRAWAAAERGGVVQGALLPLRASGARPVLGALSPSLRRRPLPAPTPPPHTLTHSLQAHSLEHSPTPNTLTRTLTHAGGRPGGHCWHHHWQGLPGRREEVSGGWLGRGARAGAGGAKATEAMLSSTHPNPPNATPTHPPTSLQVWVCAGADDPRLQVQA